MGSTTLYDLVLTETTATSTMAVLGLEKRNGVRFPDGPATVIDDERRASIVRRTRRSASRVIRKSGDVSRL